MNRIIKEQRSASALFVLSDFRKGLSALCFCFVGCGQLAIAQDIAVGSWRLHLSYRSIHQIAFAPSKVFGATESGILAFDRADGSLSSYNKLNALGSTGISSLAFSAETDQLLVGYEDGHLDLISDTESFSFSRLKNSTDITGSRSINHIATRDALAYLSTDFGVVVFDLNVRELRETWRGLDPDGSLMKVIESTFKGDSIFLATVNGVLAGDLNDNLLDFNSWRRFENGDFAGEIKSITTFQEKVYAAINGAGIYVYENGSWTLLPFFEGENFQAISGGASRLMIATIDAVYQVNTEGQIAKIEGSSIESPNIAKESALREIWIGDSMNGLLLYQNGNFTSYLPNGPHTNETFKLKFNAGPASTLSVLGGGFSNAGQPLNREGVVSDFQNGNWSTASFAVNDITDLESIDGTLYIASFGDGIQSQGRSSAIFNTSNSTLQNVDGSDHGIFVSAIARSNGGLWALNYGASSPLHFYNNGEWKAFSFPIAAARYPTDMVVDLLGQVWMTLDPARGGGVLVYNADQDAISYRAEGPGNGALLSSSINCIALDKDGYVWVGSDEGVSYFYSASADAAKPIFENRFLLRDQFITAIEVDGGNRKWIGTPAGVWLFSSTGEQLIYHFTSSNSPLLSDNILDIEINEVTGEVFFATDRGVISYRSDATESTGFASEIKIFPNPVTSAFRGVVSIQGLAFSSTIKITDAGGKLVWEGESNGGTATWNVRDLNGRRAATGVYVVFAASSDGRESVVGKLAVVD